MIRYRPFRNTDPPRIAEMWCNRPPQRSLVQPMSGELLEQRVYGKPYFDRCGLIVAEDETERIVGFAHGGFGAGEDGWAVDYELGAICLLMVSHHGDQEQIATELLQRCERYLVDQGAVRLQGGSAFPANPFYLGLYGGGPSPGIMESDREAFDRFRQAGYEPQSSHVVMQRPMASFRPVIDREQMALRRKYIVTREEDPPAANWWEACTVGVMDRTLHRLIPKGDGTPCGSVTYWDMDRMSGSRGVRTMGLVDIHIPENQRGQGLGTFLIGESLRYMHQQGMAMAEVQLPAENRAAIALFRKLGFTQVDQGHVLLRCL